jgi:hypothetical protein
MLSIGKLGQGQADYYLRAVGQGIEDYYSGDGEAPGWWTGSAADELDVFGQVDGELLHRALNGHHPTSGDQLARPPRGGIRVPGFDLTFSAPKSVSVLYALGDDDVRPRCARRTTPPSRRRSATWSATPRWAAAAAAAPSPCSATASWAPRSGIAPAGPATRSRTPTSSWRT